jgi:hypothetical protein
MSGVEVLQTRVVAEVASQVDALRGEQSRADWLRALVVSAAEPAAEVPEPVQRSHDATAGGLADSVPSPGVVCMGPGCWQRDTRKYGLRNLPLCRSCAAALTGVVYRRPVTPRQGWNLPAA